MQRHPDFYIFYNVVRVIRRHNVTDYNLYRNSKWNTESDLIWNPFSIYELTGVSDRNE